MSDLGLKRTFAVPETAQTGTLEPSRAYFSGAERAECTTVVWLAKAVA